MVDRGDVLTHTARRALRVLASPPLPPAPDASALIPELSRRPGDLHDAVAVRAHTATVLDQEARRTGIHRDVIASTVLELALAREDLGAARADQLVAPLTDIASRPLSAAEAGYLRTLTIGRRRQPQTPAEGLTVALPVRILRRVTRDHLDATVTAQQVDSAISWETSALIEGRTLSECVLLHASKQPS